MNIAFSETERILLVSARALAAVPFVVNGSGLIPQDMAFRELKQAGFSDSNIPRLMGLARIVEVIGGLALAMGVFPELGSLALALFLTAATVTGHAFWRAPTEQSRMHQLVSFILNICFLGGLVFIAACPQQPAFISLYRLVARR